MYYSIIIPVYNRPGEMEELLESLTRQSRSDFEVIIVEDGSHIPSREIAACYSRQLSLTYYYKENSGPGPARNYGAERAKGDILLFFDSDCVLPPSYLDTLEKALTESPVDLFGGPDRAADNFTAIQKAINYSMTSFLTTGGIRGGRKSMDRFYPRTFNLGISRDLFHAIGGFAPMRYGEDLDLSIRATATGCRHAYLPGLWVWHKRRTTWKQFFKQVYHSGCARIDLWRKYPRTLRVVHILPVLFLFFCVISVLLAFFVWQAIIPILSFAALIFIDAFRKTRIWEVSALAVVASFVQLIGYGSGVVWRMNSRLNKEK